MKKNFMLLIGISFLFLSSCVKNEKAEEILVQPYGDYASTITKGERNLQGDLLKMVELNKKIAFRLFSKGVSKEDYIAAVRSRDDSKLRMASGFSEEEYNSMSTAMNEVKAAILKKYPEVQRLVEQTKTCSSCDIDRQVAVVNSLNTELVNGRRVITLTTFENGFNTKELAAAVEEGGDCDWAAYTACLVVCAATGPWIYWPCAYLCVKSWCK